jgi:hypothetical protein
MDCWTKEDLSRGKTLPATVRRGTQGSLERVKAATVRLPECGGQGVLVQGGPKARKRRGKAEE